MVGIMLQRKPKIKRMSQTKKKKGKHTKKKEEANEVKATSLATFGTLHTLRLYLISTPFSKLSCITYSFRITYYINIPF